MSALMKMPERPSLKIWSDPSPEQRQYQADTLLPNRHDGRTTDPAVVVPWALREVLDRLKRDWPNSRKPGTWDQYDTLLRYWEVYFGRPGPCVSTITSQDLQGFFLSVEQWGAASTWKRNSDQLTALLKAACRQSNLNREGLPRDHEAPLRIDDLPFVQIPPKDWFSQNRTPGEHRSGGHTPKRRSTITLDEFQLVMDSIWSPTLALTDRIWWETMFGWLWFFGMRITQAREQLRWCSDGVSDGIDLNSRSLVTTDSKCGGQISVPIPDCLIPGLQTLWHTPRPEGFRDFVFFGPGHLCEKRFYIGWKRIWEHAIPCANDAEREIKHFLPHELRSVSCTHWDLMPSPDNKVSYLITGHQPGDVRTEAYFNPGDVVFRQIVNRYPMPRLRAVRPLFV